MLKKTILGISILFQVMLVATMSYIIYSRQEQTEIIENLFSEEFLTSNIGEEVVTSDPVPFSSYLEMEGVVVPSSGYVQVINPLEGHVEKLFVGVGDVVGEGEPLFKMSDKSIYVEVKEKEARLNKSLAQLSFLQKGPSKFELLAKQKEIEEKEIKKQNQKKETLVFQGLLEKTAVSMVEFDEKNMLLQLTEKELEKAHAEYEDLNAPMTQEEENIYLCDIEEKKAALKLSTLKLERSLVKSPMEGRVIEVSFSTGEYLKEKGCKSITLAKESPGMIKLLLNEDLAYKIKKNKGLRAVAVHPADEHRYIALEYVTYNPKMSIYKNGERKLELYFSFASEEVPLYLEQPVKVFIETKSFTDLSFLHYKFM